MPDHKEQNQLKELLGKLDDKQLEQVSIILVGPLFVQGFATKRDGAARRFNPGDEGYRQPAIDAISDFSNDSPYQFMKDFGEKLKDGDNMRRFEKMLVKDDNGKPKINDNVKEVFEGLSDVKSESKNRLSLFGREGAVATNSRETIKETIAAAEKGVAPQSGPAKQ